ncbi:MAG: (Fe-S)-binding protein [Acidimicrobiia bacterium]|nr:(Fe-S)-binding protein [Acidimicrobiia bacterium]
MKAGWVTPDAPREEELAACVHCGLCLPVCPTYRLTGDEAASPRGRLAAMSAVANGSAAVEGTFDEMMSFCLQCRACEVACPSLVPFGRAMEGARAELATQRSSPARRARGRLLGSRGLGSRRTVALATTLAAIGQRLRVPRWMPGRLAGALAGLRPLPLRTATTLGRAWDAWPAPVGTAALLAGCVMDPWFAAVHAASIEVLRRAGYRVEVPAGQVCCGALAAHDGAADEARALAAANQAAFAGYDLIVVDSAGCGAHLKEYGSWIPGGEPWGSRVRDITEVVAAAISDGRLPTSPENNIPVAVQDPCHLRHAQRIIEAPRTLVRAAGYTVTEIDPLAMCCGAAGVYSLLHPETSAELGGRKAEQISATGAQIVASANPGCEMQLRTHLDAEIRVAHPIELYAEVLS